MSSKKFNNINQPVVLVAPLDWGLGHATRCIPIIKYLIELNCKVLVGADGKSLELLKMEFPELTFLDLPGYGVTYSSDPRFLKLKIIAQVPKILKAITEEHEWLKKAVIENNIDIVISDNRYGLYNKGVYSIFMTHQLLIKGDNLIIEKIMMAINYMYIKRFKQCWIPDNEEGALAGKLSHPQKMPKNAKYIGPLSRLNRQEIPQKYDYLILLSGPEPQRSILETLMAQQTFILKGHILFVRGTSTPAKLEVHSNCEILDFIKTDEVSKYMNQSSMVICRSGYTTIMDLVKLNKKAILIPTPGQTEQEYLGHYLNGKYNFLKVSQNRLSDLHDMVLLSQKQPVKENGFQEHFQQVMDSLIQSFLSNQLK